MAISTIWSAKRSWQHRLPVGSNGRLALLMFSMVMAAGIRLSRAAEPVPRILSFPASNETILNPERGFYRFRDLTSPVGYDQVRRQGQSIIYGRVLADAFRDRPLSDDFLAQIQAGFDAARTAGLKVKFRFTYNNGFEPDAPKATVLQHIEQLRPLWERNKDVIYQLDAGFIGAWGEWHGSTNGLESIANRREILQAILQALPVDRMVSVRTPHYKRAIFSGSPTSAAAVVTAANGFDGSDLARVGHVNDCFLSSPNDMGTYLYLNGPWPLERELDYIGGESLYVPFGGETCGLDERSDSSVALAEMERLHIDYLNLDYHPQVIQRWRAQGVFTEIDQRLGYRFQLATASLPAAVRPGGLLPFGFTVENVGFGELFNPRPVEVILRNEDDGSLVTARLQVDPRRWAGGTTQEYSTWLNIPAGMAAGTYAVGLGLPDAADTLRADPRYAVRFANEGIWDEQLGIHWLTRELTISLDADGTIYAESAVFREVLDRSELRPAGDLNRDDVLDADDVDTMSAVLRSAGQDAQFDLDGDGQVNGADREFLLEYLLDTAPGDANLDGRFDSADLVQVFQAGRYETASGATTGWGQGDWDGDGEFTSQDLVLAMQQGTYEAPGVARQVPEPSHAGWWLFSLAGMGTLRRALQLRVGVSP